MNAESRFADGLRAILVLNAADAILTLLWIQLGLATEANPLLATLAHSSPAAFVTVKLTVVSVSVLVLFRHPGHALARAATATGLFVYIAICAYHLSFAVQVSRGLV